MADKDTLRNADFVEHVVRDAKSPPDTLLLTGWLGDAAEEGHRRLYTNAELSCYIDIPTDAILHAEPIRDVQPAGGVFVWIKRDAALKQYGSAAGRAARFLEGQVQQGFGGGAAGRGPIIPINTQLPSCNVSVAGACPSAVDACPSGHPILCETKPPTAIPPCTQVGPLCPPTPATTCTQIGPHCPTSCGLDCQTQQANCTHVGEICLTHPVECTQSGPKCPTVALECTILPACPSTQAGPACPATPTPPVCWQPQQGGGVSLNHPCTVDVRHCMRWPIQDPAPVLRQQPAQTMVCPPLAWRTHFPCHVYPLYTQVAWCAWMP